MREVHVFPLADGRRVTLRPARPNDAAAIIETVRSGAEERSYVLMEVYGKDAAEQRAYIEKLDGERNLFLVAAVGDALVGIMALLDTPLCASTGRGLSVGLHLASAWRGRGIGSAMMRYAERWARAHGYPRIEADIFTANQRSLHLFRKAGFKEDLCRRRSVRLGARQIDEVVLTRVLR